jgi:hypothetical protein
MDMPQNETLMEVREPELRPGRIILSRPKAEQRSKQEKEV